MLSDRRDIFGEGVRMDALARTLQGGDGWKSKYLKSVNVQYSARTATILDVYLRGTLRLIARNGSVTTRQWTAKRASF